MAYRELIKNFEKIRTYMRDFYLFGFKSRSEFDRKSARSYDDERRRIESWLGEHMRFVTTRDGKRLFLSIDSRLARENPLYAAWKSKSFTDRDITLHFLLLDILDGEERGLTLAALTAALDDRLSVFPSPILCDESTVRKKLKEYVSAGILIAEKQGKQMIYRRARIPSLAPAADAIAFFTEAAPCGVIGSFLGDRLDERSDLFTFKHHYITSTLDDEVLTSLFSAMHEKRTVTVKNAPRGIGRQTVVELLPLRIYISAQNGRQNLIACHLASRRINSYRLDYLSDVVPGEVSPLFDKMRRRLDAAERHMWGVNCSADLSRTEHVEFDVSILPGEEFVLSRLERERRCGRIEPLGNGIWRFSADVYDTGEMVPWIRTFLSRITRLHFSNRTVENRFRRELGELYAMYGIGGDADAVQ